MIATATRKRPVPPTKVLHMENGDMLTLTEFPRSYEEDHDIKKAELIEGVANLHYRIALDHSQQSRSMQNWIGTFAIEHDLEFYTNATLLLDTENSFHPDAMLCSKPRKGGRVWLNKKGYHCGAPELVVEVAASTASIDLRDKLRVYRRTGVSEYIVWRTQDREVDWFVLEEGQYVRQTAGRDHHLRSRIFPKLVLDVKALLTLDGAKLIAGLKR